MENKIDSQKSLRAALSEGLSAWLTFEHHAGRDELFSERYLALPIAQILRSFVEGKVVAEHNHPVLYQPGRSGRQPQLDFIVEDQGRPTLVLESKWAAERGVSVADVVWDCVRLELAAHHYKCDALFVLAGTRAQIDRVLSSTPFNPKTGRGVPSPVLGLNGRGRSSLNVQSPMRDFGPPLHKIFAGYPMVKWPRSFVCSQGTQIPQEVAATRYSAAVWHIKPEAEIKRYTFLVEPSSKTSLKRPQVAVMGNP